MVETGGQIFPGHPPGNHIYHLFWGNIMNILKTSSWGKNEYPVLYLLENLQSDTWNECCWTRLSQTTKCSKKHSHQLTWQWKKCFQLLLLRSSLLKFKVFFWRSLTLCLEPLCFLVASSCPVSVIRSCSDSFFLLIFFLTTGEPEFCPFCFLALSSCQTPAQLPQRFLDLLQEILES